VSAASGAVSAGRIAARRVKTRSRRSSLLAYPMGASVKFERTALSSVQEGDVWRVRIAWPNGAVHYFGSFVSEKDAIQWIDAHAWLTIPATTNTSEPPKADPPAAGSDDQQTNDRGS